MIRFIALLVAISFYTLYGYAQTLVNDSVSSKKSCDTSGTNSHYLTIGGDGLKISNKMRDSIRSKRTVNTHFLMFDLGFNALHDASNYANQDVQQYLQVPGNKQNGNLYSLRQGKSINVNIWPVLLDINLLRNRSQKISLYTGAGLQIYNFRFNKDISHLNNSSPMVIDDSVNFSKNKLAFAYLSVPLMVNFKTKVSSKLWVTYGLGVIGGYCFDSWTKQISDERGKQKNHDQFNFQKFNLNLSGEIGLKGYIRLYGTYQVTNLYQNTMSQNPYAIGIRFFGV